jgi:tetratricopeptide (TPR) repeat protein
MTRSHVLLAAVATALLFPLPAAASKVVIGTSSARLCYQAAERRIRPSPDDLQHCEEALAGPALLIGDELVATHVNRGIVRMRRGDLTGAIADYEAARAMDPDEPETYLNHGTALVRSQQAAAALDYFTQALRRNTRRPALAFYGRAVAHETLGNVREAYRDYRRASEIDPSWADPQRELRRFRVGAGGS